MDKMRLMVITDLDGTLLDDDKLISKTDIETLKLLGQKGFLRVAATGRSLKRVDDVLREDSPFDYVIFSTGAGIINWKTREIILANSLPAEDLQETLDILLEDDLSFFVFRAIPNNHHSFYHLGSYCNENFLRLLERYHAEHNQISSRDEISFDACQVLVMFDELSHFERIKPKIKDLKVIRVTSPFDNKSVWMEIFPKHVSKSSAVDWLCNYTGVAPEKTVGIGNDYNDYDFLKYANKSYIVQNAPEELHKHFEVVASNTNNGFTEAIKKANLLE